MKILALEISSAAASVAVRDGDDIVAYRPFDAPRGRGAEVFSMLKELRPLWLGLDRIAVGIGPGSYNGLRVACALAGSFHLALGAEVAVIPSPCLLDVPDGHFFAAGDARGGRVFYAEVKDRELAGGIALLDMPAFAERLRQAPLPVYRVGDIPGFAHLPPAHPQADVLARLAHSWPAADPALLEPIYLKPPHITAPRENRP